MIDAITAVIMAKNTKRHIMKSLKKVSSGKKVGGAHQDLHFNDVAEIIQYCDCIEKLQFKKARKIQVNMYFSVHHSLPPQLMQFIDEF